jgi:hypothetical protein
VASKIELGKKRSLAVYKVRIPKSHEFQLLFTVGLASTGDELALCLPSAWPLNQSSLKESRFSWPLDLLNKVSVARAEGVSLCHGDILNADHPALANIAVPESIKQWVISLNQVIETERENDVTLPQTLLMVPVTAKKPIKPGPEDLALADKKMQAKWKALALKP